MLLDLSSIGAPVRGIFLFGHAKKPETKEESPDRNPPESPAASPESSRIGKLSVNPAIEALQTFDRMERARRILKPFEPAPERKSLGANIDLKA
jgi:hypothetical protein